MAPVQGTAEETATAYVWSMVPRSVSGGTGSMIRCDHARPPFWDGGGA